MARVRDWYTYRLGSGSLALPAFQDTVSLTGDLVDPTLLRTRAFAAIAYSANDTPPFYPGNAKTPIGLRVLVHAHDDPPPGGWAEAAVGNDDVVFHPIVWGPGLYVPGNVTFGREEFVHYTGSTAGGAADSAGKRHVAGTASLDASWFIGPVLGFAAVEDTPYTAQLWLRCLVEATI